LILLEVVEQIVDLEAQVLEVVQMVHHLEAQEMPVVILHLKVSLGVQTLSHIHQVLLEVVEEVLTKLEVLTLMLMVVLVQQIL
jgi:hypothetical protein